MQRSILLIGIALVLAACGTDATAPVDRPGTDSPDSLATSAPNGDSGDSGSGDHGGTASVDLTLTGGDAAGTYSGSVPDGGCSRGPTGEGTFGLQYSTSNEVDLTSVQIIVEDREAAASGTDLFLATVGIGDAITYRIRPPEDDGSGTLTLDDRGDTATIRIEAETVDGVGIDATVTCHSVLDLEG